MTQEDVEITHLTRKSGNAKCDLTSAIRDTDLDERHSPKLRSNNTATAHHGIISPKIA
jgi:hypothetical protein